MKRTLLLSFTLLLTEGVWAQCAQNIRLAQSTYEQGRLHEIYDILRPCLNSTDITKQEKVQALKLLAETYIYLEEPEKADSCMLAMLGTDPYTNIDESVDPPEFKALYKTFRTNPIYRFGAKVGVNLTGANMRNKIQVVDGDGTYKPALNFQAGTAFEIPIDRYKLYTLNPEAYFLLRSIRSTFKTPVSDRDNITSVTEQQTWVSVPISLQYNILRKDTRFNPFASIGISTDYLLSTKMSLDRTRINHSPVGEKSLEPARKKINLGIIASGGIKLKMGGGYLITECRYNYGLTPVNSVSTSFENEKLALDYGFADSPYKTSTVSVTIGYVQNVFNPKKLPGSK